MRIENGEAPWSRLRFELKTRSNQPCQATKGVGHARGLEENILRRGEEGYVLLATSVNYEASSRPRVSDLSMELEVSHVRRRVGGVHTNFGGYGSTHHVDCVWRQE